MEAGQELDALVAEKVMGWTNLFPVDTHAILGSRTGINARGNRHQLPSYSTDIAAAWAVVEKLMMQDIWIAMCPYSFHAQPVGWFVEYFIDKDKKGGEIEAATAPLAICLAALKAVGYSL
jgi:hypothetical protein